MSVALEQPLCFDSRGDTLFGILHGCTDPAADTGVLIVVGGPQYRVGSHRQFVVLARGLAEAQIATFRFDCRGMGDSTGEFPGFEALDDDIASAIDAFQAACPHVRRIVLWGLCDGASAAAFYGRTDSRVVGMCLVNPWVRTEQGEAAAVVKHYYAARVLDPAFWHKLLSGRMRVLAAAADLVRNVRRSVAPEPGGTASALDLPTRLFRDLAAFPRELLFVISGNDLTASEFMLAAESTSDRSAIFAAPRVEVFRIHDADHTFSRRSWMGKVIARTVEWVRSVSTKYC